MFLLYFRTQSLRTPEIQDCACVDQNLVSGIGLVTWGLAHYSDGILTCYRIQINLSWNGALHLVLYICVASKAFRCLFC